MRKIKPQFITQVSSFIDQKYEIESEFDLSISTDSRSYNAESIFVALCGESFNGIDYAEQVIKNGCKIIIYTDSSTANSKRKELEVLYPEINFIRTKNSTVFLQEIAHIKRKNWKGKIISLTGSNGKTTTKEMIVHILKSFFADKVHGTQGNFNNHIGVPYTLLELDEKHEVAVVEMGTNHPGEIKVLCDIANPNDGMITNIGDSHLEFFKSRKNVFYEKKALFDEVVGNKGLFLINKDDPFLENLEYENSIKVGESSDSDFALKLSHNQVHVVDKSKKYFEEVTIKNKNVFGEHNFRNMAHAFIFLSCLYPEQVESFKDACEDFLPKSNRSSLIKVNEQQIFLDAYNANPSSMMAAIEAFESILSNNKISKDECVLVLGDMNELGDSCEDLHAQVGKKISEKGFNNIRLLGRYADFYSKGINKKQMSFKDVESYSKKWSEDKKLFKYIFIKGSRSLQLESLMDIN